MNHQSSVGNWLRSSVYVGLSLVAFSVVLTALCYPAVALAADPIEVTGTGDDGSPGTLRWAITQGNADPGPDTITFTPAVSGTIVLTATLPRIEDTLDVRGPGADTLAVSGDDAYRVFDVAALTSVTITALAIRDGYTVGGGGGIHTGGTLVLSDTSVISNTAGYGGGGLYVEWGSVTLNGSQFSGNTAGNGGAVFVENGSVTLNGGEISDNHVSANGGGVHVQSGDISIDEGQLSDNTAANGGAVFLDAGHLALNSGEISGNTAADGGAMFVDTGSSVLHAGEISGNTATSRGGAVYVDHGLVTVVVAEINDNNAAHGGGVYIMDGTLRLIAGKISGNTAICGDGGGVFVAQGNLDLSGGEISGNTATADGGGLYVDLGYALLADGDIAGNTAAFGGGGVYIHSGEVTLGGGGIISNTSVSGGGIYVSQISARLDTSGGRIAGNSALGGFASSSFHGAAKGPGGTEEVHPSVGFGAGGGLFVQSGVAMLTFTPIQNNTAALGGGVYALFGTTQLAGAEISGNSATGSSPYGCGGAVYVDQGTMAIISMRILRNRATTTGGALYQLTGDASVDVTRSCIVGNSGTSVYNAPQSHPSWLAATENWWGTADGPSGTGSGSGDSVSDFVDYAPFEVDPLYDCPTLGHLYMPMICKGFGLDP